MLELRYPFQRAAHEPRLVQFVLGFVLRLLRTDVLDGHLPRLQSVVLMAEYEERQHDVLVIGAGGAGLRAAIEASANGQKVALICKSLLGKAHTVMAEGGV